MHEVQTVVRTGSSEFDTRQKVSAHNKDAQDEGIGVTQAASIIAVVVLPLG